MKIIVLSRSSSISSTRRLVEAARARGHRARVVNPVKIEMHLGGHRADLYYQRKKVRPCDVVIPRIAQSISTYGLAVVNQFAMRGTPLLNSAQAIAHSRNKMRMLQLLAAAGIDIPSTVMARNPSELKEIVRLVGGLPVMLKLIQGQDRHGVMICESLQSLEAALEAMIGLGHNLIIQQYVPKTGQDIRVLVVGSEAVAAVRRRPRMGRLSRTLLRGARLEKIDLSDALRRVAIESARLLGLEVAAVDLLDLQGSAKVFEVNSSPALLQMEMATGQDLASRLIERAEQLGIPSAQQEALPVGLRRPSPAAKKVSGGRR
jgi:ribosomal protein S6--L-glutamate ligase